MSVGRLGEDEFQLITAAPAQWHDFEVLRDRLPDGLELVDITDDYSTLILTGPKSRALLAGLTEGDRSLG